MITMPAWPAPSAIAAAPSTIDSSIGIIACCIAHRRARDMARLDMAGLMRHHPDQFVGRFCNRE